VARGGALSGRALSARWLSARWLSARWLSARWLSARWLPSLAVGARIDSCGALTGLMCGGSVNLGGKRAS
jgi:hypothetical protein